MRLAAFQAWTQANANYKKAMEMFQQHPGFKSITRPDRFLRRWGAGFAQRKSFSDKKRPGRRRILSAELVRKAVSIFTAGDLQHDPPQPFTGIREALELSAELRAIASPHNMNPRTLLRNMQAAQPSLVKRMEDLKPILDQRLKTKRLVACDNLLKFSDQWFRRVFWLDAKTMHIEPKARKVWVDSKAPMPIRSDARKPRSGKDRRTLHFYAMVNWCVGPVALIYVTGTSEMEREKEYMVSHSFLKKAPVSRWP